MIDINKLVRTNILKLKPYTAARDNYLSGTLLDANENSLGSVIDNNLELNRYPDPAQGVIRQKLSELISVKKERLFFGVGSDEIIDLLIRIFCEPSLDNIIIPEPTYGMYKVAADINNVETIEIPLDDEFQPDIKLTMKAANENTKMIFLCSPNNPTGNVLHRERVEKILSSFNGIVVVDEAYIEFDNSYELSKLTGDYNNLVLLRTFSKAWGLAGVRCGYCIADEVIIKLLFKVKAPYNMNRLTSDAIIKAIENVGKRNEFIMILTSERKRISAELNKVPGIEKVFDSNANFILFRCRNANTVYKKMVEKGIIIRNRSNQLNLENCLRVSVGSVEENNQFLETLKEVI
jgi:histidinol-phosphate aminotransferase